ncbi:unnamed protein product, partial [Adineta ricciae]
MLLLVGILCFIFVPFTITFPQINLDLTDSINEYGNVSALQHHCLHVATWNELEIDPYQIISFCMNEYSSKWNLKENNIDRKFTFADLYQLNITSEQLYLWSAPFDVIERYYSYTKQRLTTNQTSFSTEEQYFYNCTLPRFGPYCQYSFDLYNDTYLTLNEIIHDYYQQPYEPSSLTCYTHLQCNRFSTAACLDWTEICDGIIDCENGTDEESCWQLEINKCNDNEFRCDNGQCIDKLFLHDNINPHFECLDQSDEKEDLRPSHQFITEPIFANEDIICPRNPPLEMKFTSSCLLSRDTLLRQTLFSTKPNNLSDDCWDALFCLLRLPDPWNPTCRALCSEIPCEDIINMTCPSMIHVPAKPIAFGHIYVVYDKEQTIKQQRGIISPHYICYDDRLCNGFLSNKSLFSYNGKTCRRPEDFPLNYSSSGPGRDSWLNAFILPIIRQLSQCNTILYKDPTICNEQDFYQCWNSSKCIAKHRLCDNRTDCDYGDDEKCSIINNSNSIYSTNMLSVRHHISFPTICDGFTELLPILIDGRNDTDETECEYWPCNNSYTRCDGFWNCLNGADEVDCNVSALLNCPSHHHICVSPQTNRFMCLPLKKAHDGHVDCLGGTDEP